MTFLAYWWEFVTKLSILSPIFVINIDVAKRNRFFNIHDQVECKTTSSIKYRYRESQDDPFIDFYWNENSNAPGFLFKNKYSNIYNPLFDQQPYEQEFPECPEVDLESIEMFSGCEESNLNVFTDICGLGTNPFISPTRIILTDPNNRNNTGMDPRTLATTDLNGP